MQLADGCFKALATVFSVREYPCDHYMSIINVTLLSAGCPRADIAEVALQLLHVLDHRFFRSALAIGEEDEARPRQGDPSGLLDGLIVAGYPSSQVGVLLLPFSKRPLRPSHRLCEGLGFTRKAARVTDTRFT